MHRATPTFVQRPPPPFFGCQSPPKQPRLPQCSQALTIHPGPGGGKGLPSSVAAEAEGLPPIAVPRRSGDRAPRLDIGAGALALTGDKAWSCASALCIGPQ